ncbi:hypothetical protein HGRIS_002966 [Hohenbuehelia grisea]|uniref:Uncharacterized protein n=1 Tax=Hohenbuehelia grisea TaxID=104357 RepID=A0ABR3JNI0_9AGAR
MPQSPAQIYHRKLQSRGNGRPLYLPEPDLTAPPAHQIAGISIGDVGICQDGSFHFLFNACAPATSPLNIGGVPDGFTHFTFGDRDISTYQYYSANSLVRGGGVQECAMHLGASISAGLSGAGASAAVTIELSSAEGAVLFLPEGAWREEIMCSKAFSAYVDGHARQWLSFARRFVIEGSSLFVVTGCDKTPTWCLAATAKSAGIAGVSTQFTLGLAEAGLAVTVKSTPEDIVMLRKFRRSTIDQGGESMCLYSWHHRSPKAMQSCS